MCHRCSPNGSQPYHNMLAYRDTTIISHWQTIHKTLYGFPEIPYHNMLPYRDTLQIITDRLADNTKDPLVSLKYPTITCYLTGTHYIVGRQYKRPFNFPEISLMELTE